MIVVATNISQRLIFGQTTYRAMWSTTDIVSYKNITPTRNIRHTTPARTPIFLTFTTQPHILLRSRGKIILKRV